MACVGATVVSVEGPQSSSDRGGGNIHSSVLHKEQGTRREALSRTERHDGLWTFLQGWGGGADNRKPLCFLPDPSTLSDSSRVGSQVQGSRLDLVLCGRGGGGEAGC